MGPARPPLMDTASKSPMEALAEFNRQLLLNVVKPITRDGRLLNTPEMVQSLTAGVAHDAEGWLEIQNRYYQKRLELWTAYTTHPPANPPVKVVEAARGDRRFRGPEWQQPYFSF